MKIIVEKNSLNILNLVFLLDDNLMLIGVELFKLFEEFFLKFMFIKLFVFMWGESLVFLMVWIFVGIIFIDVVCDNKLVFSVWLIVEMLV